MPESPFTLELEVNEFDFSHGTLLIPVKKHQLLNALDLLDESDVRTYCEDNFNWKITSRSDE